jgi:hypothetical protein
LAEVVAVDLVALAEAALEAVELGEAGRFLNL